MIRGPQFLVRLRSHTVYENASVKLFCTVDGFPMPIVKWWVMIVSLIHICITDSKVIVLSFRYKDDVILDVSSGRYLTETTGGIHSLEIPRYSEQQGSLFLFLLLRLLFRLSLPVKISCLVWDVDTHVAWTTAASDISHQILRAIVVKCWFTFS